MLVSSEDARRRRRERKRQFAPLKGKFSHSTDMVSTFEIKADYIRHDEPDPLDMYRVEDQNYGIQFAREGHRRDRVETFSWSPLEKLDVQQFKLDQINRKYKKIEYGVIYKLFLGYEEETVDMFSSLCQMEA